MRKIGLCAALLGAALVAGTAAADTLRCQSVNGNVTCAGSGGASCQTVDGRTVCQSANGAAVQVFGQGRRDEAAKADRDAAHRQERLIREDWDDEQD